LTPPLDQRTNGPDHLQIHSGDQPVAILPAPLAAGFFLSSQAAAPATRCACRRTGGDIIVPQDE
jgi:hypothetical protein